MTMKSNIYTETGDNGTTSLVGGKRVKKTDIRIEAYGTVDELNAFLGKLAINCKLEYPEMYGFLRKIQNKLFNIGAYLASDNSSSQRTPCPNLTIDDVNEVEHIIDTLDGELPPIKRFILPGGSQLSASSQVCRVVTRRCERRVFELADESYVDPVVLKYLNRLSDFFFVFARYNNIHNQIEEIFWNPEA